MLYRNHEAWIAYDGVAVPELAPLIPDAEDRSVNMATAYVMSEKDKVFTVNWRHIVPKSLLSVSIRMDGVLVHQHISMPGTRRGQLSGIVSGANTIRPFVFSNVPRLQNPGARADTAARRDFGIIRVDIVPIHFSQSIPALTFVDGTLSGNISPSPRSDIYTLHCVSPLSGSYACELIGLGSLHKDCLLDSVMGEGNSPTISIMPPFDMQLMNVEAATFEFRYGPLICLQNIGVVPPMSGVGEGAVNATPSTPIPSTLGKRSRSQYEDSEAEAASGKAPDNVIKAYITRCLVKEEAAEDSVVSE